MSEEMVAISVSDLEMIASDISSIHGDFEFLSRFADDVIENTFFTKNECLVDLGENVGFYFTCINISRSEGGKTISGLREMLGEILGNDRRQRELVEDMIATDTDIPF